MGSSTTHSKLKKLIEEQSCRVRELKEENTRLRKQIAELEEKLRTNSENSSKPPSSDPMGKKPANDDREKKRKGKKRKPGGQPGHEGKHRPLLPPDQVDEVIDVKPETCCHCGNELSGEDPSPHRHQYADIPEIKPKVTEVRLHSIECEECGTKNCAELPLGVSTSSFGPRLTGILVLLTGVCRMSKRMTQQLLADLFGLDISLGSIIAAEQRISRALTEPVEDVHEYVQSQEVVHADETGWRENGKKVYLWVACTALATIFIIRPSRGATVAKELLGEFAGILVSDRYGGYKRLSVKFRQFCWAHLNRDFIRISERGGKSKKIGKKLLDEFDLLFAWWHRIRDGTLKRKTLQRYVKPLRKRVKRHLRNGAKCGHSKTEGTCRELLKNFDALWTFVDLEGVEPTNNAAERAIRPAVLWRKNSFGTWSEAGSRFVERMMTVRETLRQQRRNVLSYLTEANTAALRGERAPSLLPNSRHAGFTLGCRLQQGPTA